MRAAGFLLMFSSLVRPYRIGAFCNRNVPRSHGKLSMSTSRVDLEKVAGDSIGGVGITLVPKVCPIPLCASMQLMLRYGSWIDMLFRPLLVSM